MYFIVLPLFLIEKSTVPKHVSNTQIICFATLQREELRLAEQERISKKKVELSFSALNIGDFVIK